jgi:hypothetical protein
VAKDVVLTCVFCKNHISFVFVAWDSISQPHGEGDFAIHYTIDMQLLGSLASLFLFVYKCGYLRALTVYDWSEHPCGISLFLMLLFLLFLRYSLHRIDSVGGSLWLNTSAKTAVAKNKR